MTLSKMVSLALSATLFAAVHAMPHGDTDAALRATLSKLDQATHEPETAAPRAGAARARKQKNLRTLLKEMKEAKADVARVKKEAFLDGLIAASGPHPAPKKMRKAQADCTSLSDAGVSGQPSFCSVYDDYCDSDIKQYSDYLLQKCAKTCCEQTTTPSEDCAAMSNPCCWTCTATTCLATPGMSQSAYDSVCGDIDAKPGYPNGYTTGCIDGGVSAPRNPNSNGVDSGTWCVAS
jgi:hypothetical protein